ncbi:MAG TPA: portal protein [Rhodanobacteraceae bacterium]|nr:portal protein [Rhodanobacteraceae bacterium]
MSDQISEAQERYLDAIKALRDQRQQITEDQAFTDPANPDQWDAIVKRQRETDPGGARPCLVFDQCGQYISNVAGQIEQRPPSLHALPVDGGADKKAAESLDGYYRYIEYASRAQSHYARALTSAARVGVGYLIVRPSYVNRALNWQEPRISSEGDPMRVVFDPWSVELDGSDADIGWLLHPYSQRQFKAEFGDKAEMVSFGSEERQTVRNERESILVAEQWRCDYQDQKWIIALINGDEVALSEEDAALKQQRGEPFDVRGAYTERVKVVKWCRMSGAEMLSKGPGQDADETIYPADAIGLVPVYGYVGWSNGRMTYCGIGRRAMHAQRSYNYHMSEIQAYVATAPKAPWMIDVRALNGQTGPIWDRANVDTRAYLPYVGVDDNGNPIAPPQRTSPSVNLQNLMAGAERALQDIQASIGMYQANLGAPSNETSGVAIDSRKQQGEASTAHFPANLAASISQVGKLCMQMVPRLIDTRRQIRILGIDGTMGQVTVDPEMSDQAVAETPQGLVINPNVGTYDVRVAVGASFATQRTQAQAAFTEIMRASPNLTPAIAPLWAQTLDVPHADKLAQVLTAVAPPEVKAVLSPEGDDKPTTSDLQAKVQQLSQALQAAIQEAHQAQQDADEAHQQALEAKSNADAREDEVAIKAYDSLTKRLQVLGATITPEQVQGIVQQMLAEMVAQPSPTEEPGEAVEGPGMDGTPAHEMAEGEQPEPMEGAMPQEDPQHEAAEMQAIRQVAEGQQQLAQMLAQLITLEQAERERIPVRDAKTGDITKVIDRLVRSAPETMQ